MKQFLSIVLTVLLFTACAKEKSPTNPIDDMIDTTTNTSSKTGLFINGPYGSVMGGARIYNMNNNFTLALENVVISNGPDLHVYISKEVQPVNYIDLGKLQSTMGNQLYAIPGMPDFSEYKYALIHCQRYNHLFGSAELR
jgi:hypothetical protein